MWSQWNIEGLQILFHIYNGTVIIRFLNLFQLQLCIDSQGATLLYTTSVFWATRTNAQVKSLLWSLFPSQWKENQGLFFWSELGSPVWNSQTMHSSHQQQQKGECIPLKNTYGLTLLQYGFAKSEFRNPCSSVK